MIGGNFPPSASPAHNESLILIPESRWSLVVSIPSDDYTLLASQESNQDTWYIAQKIIGVIFVPAKQLRWRGSYVVRLFLKNPIPIGLSITSGLTFT